ncbi:MAG: methyltransferase domain-containing protein [Gemmatimonadaceae bacterium]
MQLSLTPRRQYGSELLDAPGVNAELVLRTVRDIARSNKIFQGGRAAVAELALSFPRLPRVATLLDVGTGAGDVPRLAQLAALKSGISLRTIGLDSEPVLARKASAQVSHGLCGSGLTLPLADRSVDVAMCSQTLHHFRNDAASALLREMNRVARVAVVVSDLRRSWIAVGGFWLGSFPLGFHAVTRHDGVLSVMRGFTQEEMADTVAHAVGVRPVVHRRLGFRLTTSWEPV